MSMNFINYGPQIKKPKRWYPEHRKTITAEKDYHIRP